MNLDKLDNIITTTAYILIGILLGLMAYNIYRGLNERADTSEAANQSNVIEGKFRMIEQEDQPVSP